MRNLHIMNLPDQFANIKQNHLRVLLISPLRNLDPNSGDVTYTEQLVSSPPVGIEYADYAEAIKAGFLIECGTRSAIRNSSGFEFFIQLAIAIWRKFEFLIRRSGIMFAEPLRIFKVLPNSYDVIHVHTFNTVFLGESPPILVSFGGPLEWLYLRARNWSVFRVNLAIALDKLIGRMWKADMFGNLQGSANLYVVPSKKSKQDLINKGWNPDKIELIPNLLAVEHSLKRVLNPSPKNLIFIGKDFLAKGGDLAVKAFQLAHHEKPDISLTLVGPEKSEYSEFDLVPNLYWLGMVARDKLMKEILPSVDLLIYPTRVDTGIPYAVLECLSSGIPIVVSDIGSLPDAIYQSCGIVVPMEDITKTSEAILELLQPTIWHKASQAASIHFDSNFSMKSQSVKYSHLYRALVKEPR